MRNLKINSEVERMKELISHGEKDAKLRANVSETVEYKVGAPDGKVYGIVREKLKYFIKESADNGVTFNYIGGIGNKTDNEYQSYNSAYRNLELKVRSINESMNTGKQFEVLPADTTSEYIVEATQEMRSEINRQREIMMRTAKLMNEKAEFINPPKFKDPEGFGQASDPEKQGDPFTEPAKAVLDKDPSFKATDPKKQSEPFTDKAKEKTDNVKGTKDHVGAGNPFDETAKDILGNSVATKKVKGTDFANKHKKAVKESMCEDCMSEEDDMFMENDENNFEMEEEFVPNGTYTVSNSGGYEIMLSPDGSAAKVRDAFGSDNPQVSDWLEIEYVETDEFDEDGHPEMEPVIDPNGYNIPLNMVMRKNAFESKKGKNKNKLREMEDIFGGSDIDFTSGDYTPREKEKFPIPSRVKYIGSNPSIQAFFDKFGGVLDYVGEFGSGDMSYVMGPDDQEKRVPTSDLERVSINEEIDLDEELINKITEAVLNSFGKHHQYQKPAFTTPASNQNTPYGQKIGKSDPFTKPVKQKVGEGEIGEDADEVMKGKTPQGMPNLGKKGGNKPFSAPTKQKVGKGEIGGDADNKMKGKTPQAKPTLGKKGDNAPFDVKAKKQAMDKLAESIIKELKFNRK